MSENRFFETMQRQAGEIQIGSNLCYNTNETIDFSFLLGIYVDAGDFGKIQPFKNIDTLLSSEAIKAIIDGNYKMFSFNAKVNEDVMAVYMPISYYSVAK